MKTWLWLGWVFSFGLSFAHADPIPVGPCALSSLTACYEQGQKDFEAYKKTKTGLKNDKNLPTLRLTGKFTEFSAILIHGMNGSPYTMNELGDFLVSRGINVVSVLLAGHGTKLLDLDKVTLGDWQKDVAEGMRVAFEIGKRPIVVGASLGGGLAIEQAEFIPGVAAALLFSPAVRIANGLADDACFLKHIIRFIGSDPGTDPVRYDGVSVNAVCEINQMIDEITAPSRAKTIKTPIFTVYTEADTVISPRGMKSFVDGLTGPHETIVYSERENLGHMAAVAKATNPHFAEMLQRISAFLDKNGITATRDIPSDDVRD